MARLIRLVLTDFRNYRRLVWEPDAPLTVITGENGSGKTNLLEALSLLVPGRGLRGARGVELPRRAAGASSEPVTEADADGWGVVGRFARGNADTENFEIATGIVAGADGKGRVFRLDGATAGARAAIGDALSAVWLTPQMDRLFGESASGRRRFLDRLVVAMAPNHAGELASHERAAAQRNRVLATRPGESVWLAGLEDAMARHGVAIIAARRELVSRLNALSGDGAFPRARLALSCPVSTQLDAEPALAVEDWLRGRLAASRAQDAARGQAHWGAQRTDLLLSDGVTGRPAAEASTGQQKALLTGVILAHARLIAEIRGEPPMLLLDEPLVHLDPARRAALMEAVSAFAAPVLLTGTDIEPFAALKGRAGFIALRDGLLQGAAQP